MKNTLRRNFTITPNALINDKALHPVTRFLFVYLASKPDDWEWRVSVIQKDLGISKPTRLKYMGELISTGWITTEQKKGNTGEFGNMDIILHEAPQANNFTTDAPRATFTAAVNYGGGKSLPPTNKEYNTNTKEKSNIKPAQPKAEADLFGQKPNANKKTIFENSPTYPLEVFKAKLAELEKIGVDLEYYHRALNNWSTAKTVKRTAKGWLATARTFMEKDKDANKLKMIKTDKQTTEQNAEMLEYLKM